MEDGTRKIPTPPIAPMAEKTLLYTHLAEVGEHDESLMSSSTVHARLVHSPVQLPESLNWPSITFILMGDL